jgi:hypothetical protein
MNTASRARLGRPRLGEILLAAGALSSAQLEAALEEQQRWQDRLGRTLVFMGFITEEALAVALSRQLQLASCRPDEEPLPVDVTQHLGVLDCERYGVMPLGLEGGALRLATADPTNAPALDELAALVGRRIEPVVATETAIARAIRKYYYGEAVGTTPGNGAGPFSPFEPPPDPEQVTDSVTVELTPIDPPPAPVPAPPAPATAAPPAESSGVEIDVEAPEVSLAEIREALERLEDDIAREVRVLRALVEILIERKVITREEYLAHVRARAE